MDFPSNAPTAELAAIFPTRLPDPERLVYDYVLAACEHSLPDGVPALSFYADRDRAAAEAIKIEPVRGWPAYPGRIPAIGVASGDEGEDQQHQVMQGGYAGQVTAYAERTFPADGTGLTFPSDHRGVLLRTDEIVAIAEYYSEPLYIPVIVELVHENRDERDRLHHELRRVLFPLRSKLLAADALVKRVTVDAQKTEQSGGGPPTDQAPFYVYISLFTVHVYVEMLEARHVYAANELIDRIEGVVVPADTGP